MIPKEKWITLIKDFQEKDLPENIIPRETEIPIEIPIKRSVSIIGPRRAGKTYEMFYIISQLLDKYDKSQIVYINFEDPALPVINSEDLSNMLKSFYEMFPQNSKRKIYLFLDEIQNVKNWEKFVRKALDNDINIFISGSSSKLLSREISTSLRGRNLTYSLFPFSFREYLKSHNISISRYLSTYEIARIKNMLEKYLINGGYPEVVLYEKEKERILKEIIEVTIARDVIERINARNIKVVRLLFYSLVNSLYFSINKFYNFLKSQGIKISKNTLYNYIEALYDAFIIFPIRRFDLSLRKIEQSIPKIYVVDNGILSTLGIKEKGRLMENLVAIELLRQGKEVYYFRNNNFEVDFVVGKKPQQLVQVSYDISDFTTYEREVKSLIKASEVFKEYHPHLLVITWDYEAEEEIKGKKIRFIPLWKWLLKM